jgi:hypothetical protein
MAKKDFVTLKVSKKLVIFLTIFTAIIIVCVLSLLLNYFTFLRLAHSTFENYYAFRGCVQLLSKTAADATCKLVNGEIIKLVLFHNRWYLDGDLPSCLGNLCF